jgi:hypothetical protein
VGSSEVGRWWLGVNLGTLRLPGVDEEEEGHSSRGCHQRGSHSNGRRHDVELLQSTAMRKTMSDGFVTRWSSLEWKKWTNGSLMAAN